MHRRVLQAALVVADGLVVVAGEVVGMAELEEGAGVARDRVRRPVPVLDGRHAALAFGRGSRLARLEVVLGAVAGEAWFSSFFEVFAALREFALLAINAGPLQLDLAGVVAGLLGLFERLEGLVESLRESRARPR